MQKLFRPSKNLYKYLITLLLVFIPLYPKFPLIGVLGTYVSIRLEDLLIAVVFIMFLPLIFKELKTLLGNKIIRSIVLYLFVGFVSLISAFFLTQTVPFHIGLLHLLRRAEYMSFFVFGYLYLKNYYQKEDIFYFIKVIGLVIIYSFIYGLLQRYFSFPIVITQNYEYSKGVALRWIPGAHINATFAGHYDLASYLVIALPLFVTSFFVFKEKKIKAIMAIISLFGYWLLASAVSRISIVSFMFATVISLLILKKFKAIVIFGLISLLLFGFSSSLRERYIRIFDVVKEKISSVFVVYAKEDVFEDRSTSIRFNVEWPRAIRALSKNPLLGTGYSSISLATDNDYLRALGETGVLGFIAFLLIFSNISRKVFLNLKLNNMSDAEKILFVSFIGGTCGLLVSAVFIDVFEASKIASNYWLLSGLTIGMLEKEQYE